MVTFSHITTSSTLQHRRRRESLRNTGIIFITSVVRDTFFFLLRARINARTFFTFPSPMRERERVTYTRWLRSGMKRLLTKVSAGHKEAETSLGQSVLTLLTRCLQVFRYADHALPEMTFPSPKYSVLRLETVATHTPKREAVGYTFVHPQHALPICANRTA
jgi:hypothetical protein